MTTFLIIAAVMAALAAVAVAAPLMRVRQSRLQGAVAAVLIVAAAAGLYRLWSNWDWKPAAEAPALAPDVAAMIAKLEKHMDEHPDDLKGWLMLGRSYLVTDRADLAIRAYEHAHGLDPKDLDGTLGLGEAMSMRAGGEITPVAAQLFEEALQEAPGNSQALLYAGFAAAVRGDSALARQRWEALKKLNPPQQIVEMLDARLADLDALAGPGGAAPGGAVPGGAVPGGMDPGGVVPGGATPGGSAPGTAAAAGEATLNIRIAPELKSRLRGDAPLFVFAREPGGRGPPLAAKRLTSAAIGSQIQLSSADSMIPGRVLTRGQQVSITARVSFTGQPLPVAGDLYGELSYDVGRDGVRDLVIDRVAQ
jgi:cytochrome c-type biogenesis protein CcmH